MNAVELIDQVIALFSDPNRHCKGASARNAQGQSRFVSDPDACSWCLMGAIQHLGRDVPSQALSLAFNACRQVLGTKLALANDNMELPHLLAALHVARGIALKALKGVA